MDSRELELIALTQLISRYRVGVSEESRLDLSEIKTQIAASAPIDDTDVEINIGNLSTESNVTIVEQTVDSDEHKHEHCNESTKEQEPQSPEQTPTEKPKETLGGRLFKYFKDDKNETV